jgi:hypothetical protein
VWCSTVVRRNDVQLFVSDGDAKLSNGELKGMKQLLRQIDKHRRTILDVGAFALLLLGFTCIVLGLLSVKASTDLHVSDWIDAGSVFIAAGGILIGIGGSRRESERS